MRYRIYAGFFCLLAVLALALPVQAVTETGDINVRATVPTPPPQTAPTIDYPKTGDRFNHKNIFIRGRCTPDLIVKIFSNHVFVGSTICQQDGRYSLRIDLFIDRNDLIARQYDALNQPSPDSNLVVVHFFPPSVQPNFPDGPIKKPPTIASFQLIIEYDYTVQGLIADQNFRLPIQFWGGTPPYIVTIEWGDGSINTFDRSNTSKFDTTYAYTRAGKYIAVIRVSDSKGQEAYLQFVVLVNGEQQVNKIFGHEISQDLTNIIAAIVALLVCAAILIGMLFEKLRAKRKKPEEKSE